LEQASCSLGRVSCSLPGADGSMFEVWFCCTSLSSFFLLSACGLQCCLEIALLCAMWEAWRPKQCKWLKFSNDFPLLCSQSDKRFL
jgi:hypothetical protein